MIQAIICLVLLIHAGLFVCGSPRMRAFLVLTSIFVANLEVEIGIGLNAPVLLSLLAAILVLAGKVTIHPRCLNLFSSRLLIFFLWVCLVSIVGMSCLDLVSDAQYGWTRSSAVKPIVQLAKLFVLAPLAIVVGDGIRSETDVRWFLTNWTRLAVISACVCMLQVGAYELTGKSVGTYRVHAGEFELTFASIGGENLLRANALAGEPKAQGLAMAMSLCMLLATYGRSLVSMSRPQHLLCMLAVEIALLLTWSSGAIAMTAVLFGLVLTGRHVEYAKTIVVAKLALLVVAVALFPALAGSIWKSRLQRIVALAGDVHATGYGEEKERPAIRYVLAKPHVALAGVGMGMGPYYFDRWIEVPGFRRKYVDPNCGILWGLFGFGLVGWCLLLGGMMPELRGAEMDARTAPVAVQLLRFALLYFLVGTPLWWLAVALGLACAPGTQHRDGLTDQSTASHSV